MSSIIDKFLEYLFSIWVHKFEFLLFFSFHEVFIRFISRITESCLG